MSLRVLKADSWMKGLAGALPRFVRKKGKSRKVNFKVVKKYQENHIHCEVPGCPEYGWHWPHHIKFRSQGGGDEEENLIRLCFHHQMLAHGKNADQWKREFQLIKRSP